VVLIVRSEQTDAAPGTAEVSRLIDIRRIHQHSSMIREQNTVALALIFHVCNLRQVEA
jgi:hypothetical protein